MGIRIILASKSPRRKEILQNLGVEFEIITADADESSDIKDPALLVTELAERKGKAVAEKLGEQANDCLIIASDTLVYANGEFLGKPRDRADARRMLSALSGNEHFVVSGIYVSYQGRQAAEAAFTKVIFDSMTDGEIEAYLDSGEPYDKAGAYAIQGKASAHIRGIEGDYFNVVGLPVNLLCSMIKREFCIDITNLG
ncbi:MAG: septum formation protein Maf [Ruminococcaceae bacterium]|nr:septum formation protein Maf [Oscillospiraceae bacterium]